MVGRDGIEVAAYAGRVNDFGEVSSDEQTARARFDLPHAIDRVEVGVPGLQRAGYLVEREQLVASRCVGVGASFDITTRWEVRVECCSVELETDLVKDVDAVGADEQIVTSGLERLNVAAKGNLPKTGALNVMRPDRIAIVSVSQ